MRAAPEQKLWVVVFDGGKALFLENKGFYDAPDLELISRHDNDNPPDRVQTTDKAGRYQDAGSGSKGEGRPADVAHGRSAVQQTDTVVSLDGATRLEVEEAPVESSQRSASVV